MTREMDFRQREYIIEAQENAAKRYRVARMAFLTGNHSKAAFYQKVAAGEARHARNLMNAFYFRGERY